MHKLRFFWALIFILFPLIFSHCKGTTPENLKNESNPSVVSSSASTPEKPDSMASESMEIKSSTPHFTYLYLSPLAREEESESDMADLRQDFGGSVLILHEDGYVEIKNPEEAREQKNKSNFPDDNPCAPVREGEEPLSYGGGGGGESVDKLPKDITHWQGYGPNTALPGGCGIWSTVVCNRILGIVDSRQEVTKKEWDEIAKGIGADKDPSGKGGSSASGRAEYYTKLKKDYCVVNEKFPGTLVSYEKMDKKLKKGCDIKINLFRLMEDGNKQWGHVETITSVDAKNGKAHTNSWGSDATISGGSDVSFKHSKDGRNNRFGLPEGSRWPPKATDVTVEYVCKCNEMEEEAKKMKGK